MKNKVTIPESFYRSECGSKANTFYRPLQDRHPLEENFGNFIKALNKQNYVKIGKIESF